MLTPNPQDPMSHRIIEKRRRDRMNNCLADLSRLIPNSYLKKDRGRIEKTEIIEMAIKHMKHLHNHPCSKPEGCDLQTETQQGLSSLESFRVGYHECLTESMHFLVEKQGMYSADPFCLRMMSHLQKHYDRLGRPSNSEIHSTVGGTWTGADLPNKNLGSRVKESGAVTEKSSYKRQITKEEPRQEQKERMEKNRRRSSSSSPERQRERVGERERTARYHRWATQEEHPSALGMHGFEEEQEASEASALYKFKSNIQHRFDMAEGETESKRAWAEDLEDLEPPDVTPFQLDVKPAKAVTFHQQPSGLSFPHPKSLSQPVPIFAFNSKGSFYVPLTIDLVLLEPFLPLLTEEEPGPYHPVTISVNFRHTLEAGRRTEEQDWKREQGVIQQPSVIKHRREPAA
jgi:YRPW motif-containing protein